MGSYTLRQYSYIEPIGSLDNYVTVSENDIKRWFFEEWEAKMIKKHGKEVYESNYTFEHCLEDFCTTHGAWLVK